MNTKERAARLLQNVMGKKYRDDALIEFLADRLSEGEIVWDITQFLKTTPAYLKTKKGQREANKEFARKKRFTALLRKYLRSK
jgi:hypothetical protein